MTPGRMLEADRSYTACSLSCQVNFTYFICDDVLWNMREWGCNSGVVCSQKLYQVSEVKLVWHFILILLSHLCVFSHFTPPNPPTPFFSFRLVYVSFTLSQEGKQWFQLSADETKRFEWKGSNHWVWKKMGCYQPRNDHVTYLTKSVAPSRWHCSKGRP